jgi:hypothetical protein
MAVKQAAIFIYVDPRLNFQDFFQAGKMRRWAYVRIIGFAGCNAADF